MKDEYVIDGVRYVRAPQARPRTRGDEVAALAFQVKGEAVTFTAQMIEGQSMEAVFNVSLSRSLKCEALRAREVLAMLVDEERRHALEAAGQAAQRFIDSGMTSGMSATTAIEQVVERIRQLM